MIGEFHGNGADRRHLSVWPLTDNPGALVDGHDALAHALLL
jgi:hypothetical protein